MHGHHLTLEAREGIAERRAAGQSRRAIARQLGCAPSTISREIRRNANIDGTYRPSAAQTKADRRRRESKAPWKLERTVLGVYVEDKLTFYWSPEQIAGRLRREYPGEPDQWVSHPTIYAWIERQKRSGTSWRPYLRQGHRKRRKRYGTADTRGRIVGRVGIEARPPVVAAKTRQGDWESDTVAGRGSLACLATHVDRCSRYTVIERLPNGTAEAFTAGTLRAFARHGRLPAKTMTADNGKEFAAFAVLERELGLAVYFARPYHAWERGLNENTNGLVRQFFPKGFDFQDASEERVHDVEYLLNTRPRKALGYRTPLEVRQR